jgi:hypothetical protein
MFDVHLAHPLGSDLYVSSSTITPRMSLLDVDDRVYTFTFTHHGHVRRRPIHPRPYTTPSFACATNVHIGVGQSLHDSFSPRCYALMGTATWVEMQALARSWLKKRSYVSLVCLSFLFLNKFDAPLRRSPVTLYLSFEENNDGFR